MDKKAKDILLKTYWGSGGWKVGNMPVQEMIKQGYISFEDFNYAKEKGLMFDDSQLSHEKCVERLLSAVSKVTYDRLIEAFLSSLSNRKLYLRSAVASFYNAKKLTLHTFKSCSEEQFEYLCDICDKVDMYGLKEYSEQDLNVMNFERIKWGGVRHNYILYCMLDLEQFILEDDCVPTDMDIKLFKDILLTIESCKSDDTPRMLEKRLKDVFPSNKAERDVLIEILAQLEILQPAKLRPSCGGKNDWGKVEDWRGEDGYNQQEVKKLFGRFLF